MMRQTWDVKQHVFSSINLFFNLSLICSLHILVKAFMLGFYSFFFIVETVHFSNGWRLLWKELQSLHSLLHCHIISVWKQRFIHPLSIMNFFFLFLGFIRSAVLFQPCFRCFGFNQIFHCFQPPFVLAKYQSKRRARTHRHTNLWRLLGPGRKKKFKQQKGEERGESRKKLKKKKETSLR